MQRLSNLVKCGIVASLAYFNTLVAIDGKHTTEFADSLKTQPFEERAINNFYPTNLSGSLNKVVFFLAKLSEDAVKGDSWERYKVEGTNIKFYSRRDKNHKGMLFTKNDVLEAGVYEGVYNSDQTLVIQDYSQNGWGINPGTDRFTIKKKKK
jgi:hypothetical protein